MSEYIYFAQKIQLQLHERPGIERVRNIASHTTYEKITSFGGEDERITGNVAPCHGSKCSCRSEAKFLNSSHQRAHCSFPRRYTSMESHSGMILTGKPKNSERNLSHCHFAQNKSHMD
jgi:hypothetical protein